MSNNGEYKDKLIQYNIEDCLALIAIKDWIVKIRRNYDQGKNTDTTKLTEETDGNIPKWSNTNFQIPDFEIITKLAYFDYQREKIFIKTHNSVKKAVKEKKNRLKHINIIDKIIKFQPEKCPKCGNNIGFFRRTGSKRTIIDLKFMRNGIKKWIVQLKGNRFECRNCGERFSLNQYKYAPKYGRNLMIWAVNQHITYNISFGKIDNMFFELFNIRGSDHMSIRFKSFLANEYQEIYNEIKQNVIAGQLIHADETKAGAKNYSSGYIWVFTNMDSVFYLFKPNREADFLKELLKEFTGILVSDFYAGYDSLPCLQQKCLIHLIRDLNDDLFQNQLNIELKCIVTEFGVVLRKILETVDKYGLKRRHLNKHKKDIEKFYNEVINKEFESEPAIYYQDRFRKNEDRLFTFLDHDGIPWNNNNAENAIKPFARYRKDLSGKLSEKGMNEYLILLSIQQTCKYRGINFLEFLKSGEMSIEEYSRKH